MFKQSKYMVHKIKGCNCGQDYVGSQGLHSFNPTEVASQKVQVYRA